MKAMQQETNELANMIDFIYSSQKGIWWMSNYQRLENTANSEIYLEAHPHYRFIYNHHVKPLTWE